MLTTSSKQQDQMQMLKPFGCELTLKSPFDLLQYPVKDLVLSNRLLLIRGLAPLPGEVFQQLIADLAGGYDHLLRWDFGYLMEVKEEPTKENYLFSNEAVPLHWDGAFHQSPFILAFQCVETAGSGGATVFSDSTRVWETATPAEQQEWLNLKINLKTEKKAHYGGELTTELVARHPLTSKPVLRFAEPVTSAQNPVEVTIEGASTCDWSEVLTQRLYSDGVAMTHNWRQGDIILADNHALLHGRQAFETTMPSGRRCLQRVQILSL